VAAGTLTPDGRGNGRVPLLALPDFGEALVSKGFHCSEASTNHFLLLFPSLRLVSGGLSPGLEIKILLTAL
jgi:hypothetical protein